MSMNEHTTEAEKNAGKAASLAGFRGVALGGMRERVAQLLGMIGRNHEIFSTYTKHDITHIDAMLRHLDWLIPPTTKSTMTEVDWLLVTLSIYLHDLGMIVTSKEFEERMDNPAFLEFLGKLKAPDPKSQAYLGRAAKMTAEERERFFFQEYIRENHPARIREWIMGRHRNDWGDSVMPIAKEIREILAPLPSRFCENLAIVCESHHRDDLNKLEKYPLCQRYGNGPSEMANVQYAALLLRTVDLIHVTKDRTPSIMYKTIRFSDPKGVEEWDKQKGAFAAHHAGRTFLPEDPATHVIHISADFTEERPFFALTEYLAWADSEIKQTKRWCDQSKELADGMGFWLPWQGIRGDLRVEGNQPQQMRFEFDRGRLLELLVGHAIYNEPTVAIRELLQNAIDAVRFQRHIETKDSKLTGSAATRYSGGVKVIWRSDTQQLIVEDTGTGMDLDIIKFHLMRVGSSFYDTPQFASEFQGFTPISRFGIGVLTCFMISDDIEIVTFKNAVGHRIRMTSVQADYLLRELLPGDPLLTTIAPHGTRVTLTLREGVDFAQRSLEDILRYWIVLPACPVEFISDGRAPVNIGYDSPADALKAYYENSKKETGISGNNVEIVSKQVSVGGAKYEMAFAVKKGWSNERTFASAPKDGFYQRFV